MAYYFDTPYYIERKVAQLRAGPETNKLKTIYTQESLLQLLGEIGLSPQQHYELFGHKENLNPNPYFNQAEYLTAKLNQLTLAKPDEHWTMDKLHQALAESGLTALEHYERYGAFEDDGRGLGFYLNPSNGFDANAYYSAKLLMLQRSDPDYTLERLVGEMQASGLSPIAHYVAFGWEESQRAGISMVQTVPQGQRVPDDPNRLSLGDIVPTNDYPDTPSPRVVVRAAPHPEDIGHYAPAPAVPEGPYEDPADPGPFQAHLAAGKLSFSGTHGLGIDVAIEGEGGDQRVSFTSHGETSAWFNARAIQAVHLALGQDMLLDTFPEIAAFFGNRQVQFDGNGSLALDITHISQEDLQSFGHPGIQDTENILQLSALADFSGARLLIDEIHEISVADRQFVEGIRHEGVNEKYKVFWTGHVEDFGDISHIPHIEVTKGAALIASKAQVSRLDGKIITGEGEATIKADMGGEEKPNQEFTVQTLGQNVIAAGRGADTIVLGEGTGYDILIFKYNDSQLGSSKHPGWDQASNFELGRDKLLFIYKWNGTNVSPAVNDVVSPNVHVGQGSIGKGISFADGVISYDAPASRSGFDKVRDVLDALDAHIRESGGMLTAADLMQAKEPAAPNALSTTPTATGGRFWANDIWAYETGGSTFILKADGFEGRWAQFDGEMLTSPGDTVIELVGVTGVQAADLVNMLHVDTLVNWG